MKEKLKLQMYTDITNATTSNGQGNNLSPEMKTYYSDYLIDNAAPYLVHDQFAQKQPIPKNGGKTIEFRRYSALPQNLVALTEGVTPEGGALDVSIVTATVAQYGYFLRMTDMLLMTAIDKNLVEATKLLGQQAGQFADSITRDILAAGTNVIYAANAGTPATSRSAITAAHRLTVKDLFRAARALKAQNAAPIDGDYIAIVHPNVSYDIMANDNKWVDVHKYADAKAIYEGEIGKIGNVRVVESSNAKVFAGGGAQGADVYATLVFGANAYAVTEIEGGGLQHIVKQLGSGGNSDPLDQRATAGWKLTKTAEILSQEYMVRIESGYSGE